MAEANTVAAERENVENRQAFLSSESLDTELLNVGPRFSRPNPKHGG